LTVAVDLLFVKFTQQLIAHQVFAHHNLYTQILIILNPNEKRPNIGHLTGIRSQLLLVSKFLFAVWVHLYLSKKPQDLRYHSNN